jgi:hypothetical protein
MVVEAWRLGTVRAESEQPAMKALAAGLAPLFTSPSTPERRGLYLASSNAGFASSLAFWAGATREGVAFASPALFPWTLSNAPCGWLAREFSVKGPNVTHTGKVDALGAALRQCWRDLDDRQADAAWVAAIDFGRDARHATRYAVVRLAREPGPVTVERTPARRARSRLHPAAALTRALRDAARTGCGGFSDGHADWTIRMPAGR